MLIGISGKRGVGKSLLGSILVAQHDFEEFSFAGALKLHCQATFNLRDPQLYGDEKERPTLYWNEAEQTWWTPRGIMIAVGNFYRSIDPMFWVKTVMSQAKAAERACITDVRFRNEARLVRDLGGLVVRLERLPEYNPYKGELDDISERDLDDYPFDVVLRGDKNKDRKDLEIFAKELLSQHVDKLKTNV